MWARILRNVEQGFKRQGSIREAWFFRSLAGGLHPEEVKMQRPYVHHVEASRLDRPPARPASTRSSSGLGTASG